MQSWQNLQRFCCVSHRKSCETQPSRIDEIKLKLQVLHSCPMAALIPVPSFFRVNPLHPDWKRNRGQLPVYVTRRRQHQRPASVIRQSACMLAWDRQHVRSAREDGSESGRCSLARHVREKVTVSLSDAVRRRREKKIGQEIGRRIAERFFGRPRARDVQRSSALARAEAEPKRCLRRSCAAAAAAGFSWVVDAFLLSSERRKKDVEIAARVYIYKSHRGTDGG